jgi:hypothetical protein
MKYLIHDPRYQAWAKAATIGAAKRALRKEIGGKPLSEKAQVFQVPDDYYIDELGNGHGSAKALPVTP